MRTLLLISSKVFHYRVSVYNYLWKRFRENEWHFQVAADKLQSENRQALKFEFFQLPFSFRPYADLVRRVKPDAVILHLRLKDRIFWQLIHWLWLRGTPVIWWTKGANLDAPDSILRHQLYGYFHSLAKALLLYSANEIKYVKPSNRRKVFVANNTLNFEDFPEISQDKAELRKEFDVKFSKVVLFAGTMGVNGERKKVEHLIEVFNRLDRTDIGLLIVGGGMPPETVSRLNPKNTRYLGQVHDEHNVRISKLFKLADLFVVPGHVGLSINQAFFWGLPVITEQGLQPPEIQYLRDGENGFIVGENNLQELSDRILLLLDDDELRLRFSQRAREGILKEASIENMFRSFLQSIEMGCGRCEGVAR